MKKLFILLTISIATVSVTAQVTPVVSKKEMKIEKHKEKKEEYKAKKEEKKEERKAMRKLEGSEVSMQAKEAFRGTSAMYLLFPGNGGLTTMKSLSPKMAYHKRPTMILMLNW